MKKTELSGSWATVPIDLHWNQPQGYFATPRNPHIDVNSTARLNASDKNCTICFDPKTTPFGAKQDVGKGTPIDIPVGSAPFQVKYCITDYGSTCTPPSLTLSSCGTIKVGSGR
jgi:hypothetical protein